MLIRQFKLSGKTLKCVHIWVLIWLHYSTVDCLTVSSEGSVIAYYLSEFRVPAGQEAAVNEAMSKVSNLVDKTRISFKSDSLVLDDVVSSGRVKERGIHTAIFLVLRVFCL